MSSVSAKVLFEYVAQQDDELTIQLGDTITNVHQEEGGWWRGEVNGKCGMFPENFVSIVKPSAATNPTSSFKAEVSFDYEPEQDDEIALIKGSIIEVIDTPDEGWWKGRFNGKEGLFPSNFVEKIETTKTNSMPVPDNDCQKPQDKGLKPSQPNKVPSKIANLLGMIKPEDLSRNNLKKTNNGIDKKNENDGLVHAEGIKPTQLVTPMHLEDEKNILSQPISGSNNMTSSSTQFALAVYDYEPELPDELELKVGDEIKIIESELTFEGWMRGEVNGNVGIFPDNFVELKPKEELQGQAIVVNKEKEDSKPQINQPIKDPPKRTKQVVMPHVVNILHDDKLKNELAGKLSKLTPVGPPPPPKAANKPPPPVPVNKPMLPSTKPKPQVPQSKPQPKLPFLSKVDNNISASPPPHNFLKDEMKTPVKPESKKMVIAPKSDEKSSVDESVEKKKLMPVIDLTLSNESKNNEQDLISLGRCASASVKEKPKVESPVVRSQSLTGQDEAPEYSKNSASIEHEMDEMANNHSKLSGKKSVQLDDIKPTDSLKHLERVKPPSKSPPSKFMDKHSSDEGSMSFDDGKEVDELKSQVRILENKMEDMAEMFKKLVIQLTDDLSTERKLRSNLQIDVETLNKKLNVFLDKPGL